jgi:anthranilate phosphoribosyltransferase
MNKTYEMMNKIFKNEANVDEAKDFLIQLYKSGETVDDIYSAVKVMREYLIPLDIDNSIKDKIIDNCGTGGDKSGSFNISTTVSLLLSSAGCYVAKHGNRSITSKSGSADMLEALGLNLNLSPTQQSKMLEDSGFCFMFAVNHHPCMKYVMPIRKSIDHRTIFNIMGPLTNPAGVKKQLIGVFDKNYTNKIAQVLNKFDTKKAIVVSSADGLDEISISDITYATKLENNEVFDFEINPEHYGFKLAALESIKGGDAKDNAKTTIDILNGNIKDSRLDIVLLNSAYALVVDGVARDVQDGLEISKETINSNKAKNHLQKIIDISNKL